MPSPRAPQRPRREPSREDFESLRVPLWVSRYEHEERVPCGPPGPAVHTYAVIILVTRGQARVRHAGEQVLRAGDVHLIPPGDPHGPAHLEEVEGWALAFRPEALSQEDAGWGSESAVHLGPFVRIRSGCHPVLRPSPAQRGRLLHWFKLIQAELAQEEPGRDDALRALLRLVLVELSRIEAPQSTPELVGLSLARRALTHIEAHCLQPLSLTEVAAALGRSPTHVAGVVRRETGRTVGEWILEYRMAEARRRLRGTDERVDIIAERVGYADVTHFIRLFRRVHGVTPAAWRRRVTSASGG
ncbi:AraC family transcriptional regulator [Hyalangium minutum]|uniref:AraC family transcriptional regulator n=1 Tax=Hyalangium minutum TaxID=394096 RepID=UPI0005C54ADE|nr:AraC family transcriptional regulator [Hyalangium minutum]